MGVVAAGGTPSLTGEFFGETHGGPRMYTNPPNQNQHQKGPSCLWGAGEVTKSPPIAEPVALFLLRPLPHRQHLNTATWVAPPQRIPKVLPLTTYQVPQDKELWPK